MKIQITEQEFREEYIKVYGKEPSPEVVRFALAYNDVLNAQEGGAA